MYDNAALQVARYTYSLGPFMAAINSDSPDPRKSGDCIHLFYKFGALILRMRGGAKHSPHMRTTEIHQKSSEINDLENEPSHEWRLHKVSRVTRDEI